MSRFRYRVGVAPVSVENGAVTVRRALATMARLAAAVLGVAGLAACAGSGFRYVKSAETETYFKVPEGWKVFQRDEVLGQSAEQSSDDPGLRYLAIFDADPVPSLDHDLQTAEHPFGLVRVRALDVEQRDKFSRSELRNEIVPIDDILDQRIGEVELIEEPESIVKPKGLAGTRLVYRVQTSTGSFTVHQIGLVDPDHRNVYFFIAGCETSCYERNRRMITEVAESWTIKER